MVLLGLGSVSAAFSSLVYVPPAERAGSLPEQQLVMEAILGRE